MNLKSLAAIVALAGLGSVAQAAVVPVEQTITLLNPEGSLVYNIATNGLANTGTTSFYQLIVDPTWSGTNTKFTTFSTEPLGTNATYALFTDADASTSTSNTGTLLGNFAQTDVPGNNLIPFFTFLLTAGQYVLQINTLPGQMNVSTNIAAVPLPGAMWLFGSALLAFLGMSARRKL
jgi:opacity protein-like surface antigen